MGKVIENKADKEFPYANDIDAGYSSYSERRAYIKGYEAALKDIREFMDTMAVERMQFPVLTLYDWLDKTNS